MVAQNKMPQRSPWPNLHVAGYYSRMKTSNTPCKAVLSASLPVKWISNQLSPRQKQGLRRVCLARSLLQPAHAS